MTITTTQPAGAGPDRQTRLPDRTAALGVALRAIKYVADRTTGAVARSGLLAADLAVRSVAARPRVWAATSPEPGPDVTHVSDGAVIYRRRTADPRAWERTDDRSGRFWNWINIPATLRIDFTHPCPPGCTHKAIIDSADNGIELAEVAGRFAPPTGRS